jgi:hypothetical protein
MQAALETGGISFVADEKQRGICAALDRNG